MKLSDGGEIAGRMFGDEEALMSQAMMQVRTVLSMQQSQMLTVAAEECLAGMAKDEPWRIFRIESGSQYNMESAAGFYVISTCRVIEEVGAVKKVIFDTRNLLPPQSGVARLRSPVLRKFMLELGVGSKSARLSAKMLEWFRFGGEGQAVVPTTIRDATEREGAMIDRMLTAETDKVLSEPLPQLETRPIPLSADRLAEAFDAAEIPPELLSEARRNPLPYTPPESTVEISTDGVCAKRQAESRRRPGEKLRKDDDAATGIVSEEGRRTVSTFCATVRFNGARLMLASTSYLAAARSVLAAIIVNGLFPLYFCLVTDGEKQGFRMNFASN